MYAYTFIASTGVYFRTAGAIRTACMTCLQAMLQSELLTSDQLSQALHNLLPKVRTYLYYATVENSTLEELFQGVES